MANNNTFNERRIKPEQLSSRIRGLRGIINTDEKIDPKKILEEELAKKYGAQFIKTIAFHDFFLLHPL